MIYYKKQRSSSVITTAYGESKPHILSVPLQSRVSVVELLAQGTLIEYTLGTRVKMSKDRLRAQCLPSGAECSYVRVTVDGHLAGNAFACRWKYDDTVICWVTQLVVHRDHRERGLAVSLLRELRRDDDSVYGIASSHPAACLAAARAFGGKRSFKNYHNCRADCCRRCSA